MPPSDANVTPTHEMTYYGSEEHEPVTWVRGYGIYAAHLVVIVFVASLIITGILQALRYDQIGNWRVFQSGAVRRGEVWRIFTYGLWNSPVDRGLWFAIDMLMLVWFGREVEKFCGRTKFLLLFAGIYLVPPVLFTAIGAWLPAMFAGETGAFAVFIAFATLFPNIPLFFTLLAKWVAWILIGLYSLIGLAGRNWELLLNLWATTGFAFVFVKFAQGIYTLPKFSFSRRKPKLRVVPDMPTRDPVARPASASMAEVDALLDKIAQSGIGSLTARERAKLDAARKELQKRSGS